MPSGAEARVTNAGSATAVLCVNGGSGGDVEGTWSASLEWLVAKLAPRHPELAFVEVRYRIKSWNRLGMCVEDGRAALEAVDPERAILLGFSMGGAVAVGVARDRRVEGVLGLAPWLPDRLDLSALDGKRLDVLHGMLDRYLPGIPGVSPEHSRRGFRRAQERAVHGTYELIPAALHGIALRVRNGRPFPLPRASRWAELVSARLAAYEASTG